MHCDGGPDHDEDQSINQSCISGLFHCILLPDHSWQIIEINQGQT